MARKLESSGFLIISAAVAGLTLLPYLLAVRLAPDGTHFAGFLINPIDGFSYLAKMREGAGGSWLFTLPYASQPGPGAFLYVYHILLGHISAWSRLPPLTVYHAARVLGAFGTFSLAYLFLKWAVQDQLTRRFAWVLVLLGSGFGWVTTLVFNHPVSDMLIPESIPFLAVLSNAHFPLALIATLAAVLALAVPGLRFSFRLFGGSLAGFILGAVLPFAAVVPAVVLGIFVIYQRLMPADAPVSNRVKPWFTNSLVPYLGFLLMLIPWAVYDLWLSRVHPVLAAWNSQNQTPSPPVWDYILGFGILSLLALIGLLKSNRERRGVWVLLLLWAGVGGILLYAPVAFQRRLSLGLFFPISALAASGLLWFRSRGFSLPRLALFAVALAIPSNLLVVGASLANVAAGDRELVYTESEVEAYAWAADHIPPGSLVLASARIGNRLPAFSDVRVLYGHPFETPEADEALDLVASLFKQSRGAEGLEALRAVGVQYVYYGPDERALGYPSWLDQIAPIASFGEVTLFKVPEK
jgi:hypothetical protein